MIKGKYTTYIRYFRTSISYISASSASVTRVFSRAIFAQDYHLVILSYFKSLAIQTIKLDRFYLKTFWSLINNNYFKNCP